MMEIGSLEATVRRELEKAEGELNAAMRQRDGIQARVDELGKVVDGLQALLRRLSPNGTRPPAASNDWPYMTRQEAVERVLQENQGPISIAQITEELGRRGRGGDTQNGVSGVLSRLKKARKAQPYGRRGFWVWADYADSLRASPSQEGGTPSE